ncbi:MAG TPA: Mrp/NBP35 family ATP-binding protein [Bacteroidales bacterium]|nr:Mrp/NBP35 family ATP-binding protein [Bacteroidales bacterium]
MIVSIEKIREELSKLQHPGKSTDLVSLGMVQRIVVKEQKIEIGLVFDKATDPFMGSIEKKCKEVVAAMAGDNFTITVGSSVKKPVAPKKKEHAEGLEVNNIIAVASGKGGVGKSTIAANLAVALSIDGYKVGLLDADIFGPSIPKLFGLEAYSPSVEKIDGRDMIIPAEKFGIKILSIGFFVDADNALIWRGPMASGALKQLITDTAWGELDFLIIDTPPGTSDIHLTLVQTIAVTGVVIVSTPQQVALADARKGISMFRSEGINVPVLGLVENMSWFTPAELPENKYYIFGKEGVKKLAEEQNIPLLAQIPLIQSICEGGDQGRPDHALGHDALAEAIRNMASETVSQLQKRNANLPPTQIVEINSK